MNALTGHLPDDKHPRLRALAAAAAHPEPVDRRHGHRDELHIPAEPVVVAAAAAFDLPALAVELPSGKALPPLVQDAMTQGVATLSADGAGRSPLAARRLRAPGYRMP